MQCDGKPNLPGYINGGRQWETASLSTPFAVHYKKIRIHLREMATNRAKIHS